VELAEIGVNLDSGPKAPLEPLADIRTRQRFVASKERVLDNLTGLP
jgi:hypothetical protein